MLIMKRVESDCYWEKGIFGKKLWSKRWPVSWSIAVFFLIMCYQKWKLNTNETISIFGKMYMNEILSNLYCNIHNGKPDLMKPT